MSIEQISQILTDQKQSLCVVESCTGGYLSYLISSYPGVSNFYKGGLVSYQNDIKKQLLGIKESEILSPGVVSETVALSMARGASSLMGSNWSVSTTGYAGPKKPQGDFKIGQVCFAVIGPDFAKAETCFFEEKQRENIQRSAASYALNFLYKSLCTNL